MLSSVLLMWSRFDAVMENRLELVVVTAGDIDLFVDDNARDALPLAVADDFPLLLVHEEAFIGDDFRCKWDEFVECRDR